MTTENKTPIINKELLRSWNACNEGFKRFNQLFPEGADLQTAMDGLIEDDHDDWAYWLFNHCCDAGLYPEVISSGYRNSGYQNSGYQNSGDRNSGYQNSGDRNSGNWNSGNWNSGDRNSGYQNSGDWNSGYWNSGYQNSGNWNSGDQNSGFFNSETPTEILVFNKLCSREDWENAHKPEFLLFDLTYWVDESEMTDEEKAADPGFYVRGGQLRTKCYKEAFIESWEKADPADREKVRELPNFDADIFFEISGIDLRDGETTK